MAGRVAVVAVLGITQTIAWASSYYMPAILGAPIATALHLPTSMFVGLFSAALLLSAVIGPSVGRLIDRHGGRVLLACSNLVIATGLVILASAHGIIGLVIAWTVLGVGIGMGLYDPAFAALTWLYGREARSSITGITLIAEHSARRPGKLALHPAPWHLRRAGAGRDRIAGGGASAHRHVNPGFLLRRHLVRAGRDGGASAGLAASGGCLIDRGNRRCCAGRARSGRCPDRRVRALARVPPDLFGPDCFGAASARRRLNGPTHDRTV